MSDRQQRRDRVVPGSDRARRAERSVLAGFVLSTLGAIVFVVAYFQDLDDLWIGLGLAAAFGGLGYGLVVWGHTLMPPGGEVEDRPPIAPTTTAEREAGASLLLRQRGIQRRKLLGAGFATAIGATGLASLVPLRSLGPNPGGALRHTPWGLAPAQRLVDETGAPVSVEALDVGAVATVFPLGYAGHADAQTLLIRIGEDVAVRPPARAEWMAAGHIAYSKICTHAGCPVGLYENEQKTLLCPCHQSAFDVVRGAVPTLGPAVRPLPQLPLDVDGEGFLIATGDFPEAVGPGWWTRP